MRKGTKSAQPHAWHTASAQLVVAPDAATVGITVLSPASPSEESRTVQAGLATCQHPSPALSSDSWASLPFEFQPSGSQCCESYETSPLRLYLFPSGGWRASQTGIYVLFVCLTLTVLSIDFRCDPSEINISDEMPKTTVWKALSMNSGNTKEKR